jgi:CBS domain containing-hemolysin-like protein
MEIALTLLIMALCLLAEGFFSGSEIGVVSADQMKLRHEAAKGSRGARLALKMLEKPEWLLSTTLVGTNIAVVTNTTIATALMVSLFGDKGSWLAVLLVAPLIWVFGEIVPKSVFQQRADSVTPRAIFVLRFFSYLFYPILVVFSFVTRVLAKLAGDQGRNPFTLREEIVTMLQMPAQHGDIQQMEQSMIRRVFNFTETTVSQVMVPLIDVHGIDQAISCGEAVKAAAQSSHVRLPVFEGRVDRVVGVLNTLDLLGKPADAPIRSYVRPARYVPGSKSIKDLLLELRREGDVVAVVVDEFGGAEGIITIEDIMEEVVEEMEDEYDSEKKSDQWIRKVASDDYVASARVELETLNEVLGVKLPPGKYATLGGFLMAKAGEIPKPGKVVEVDGLTFTIKRSTARAIQEVRIQR